MLQEIYIKNFVLIDEVRIAFHSGLNVLTGETGAGKSIIIDALSLVLGDRMKSEYIRDEAHKLVTEAVFDISSNSEAREILQENGLLDDEGDSTLIITREIQAGGKSVSRINGRTINAAILKNLAPSLVDMHLQNARHNILKPSSYLDYVDSFAMEIGPDLEAVQRLYYSFREMEEELDNLRQQESTRLQRIDFLGFQIAELEAMMFIPGEEENLVEQRTRVRESGSYMEACHNMHNLIYAGSPSAYDSIYQAAGIARKMEAEPFFQSLQEPLNAIYYSLEDIAERVAKFKQSLDFEPGTLDHIEERLYNLARITKKYGRSIDDLIVYLDQAREEYQRLQSSDILEEELVKKLAECRAEYDRYARRLGKKRQEAAVRLQDLVQAELIGLNMPDIRFRIVLKESPVPGQRGYEQVEFLFSANPGEEMAPVHKTASGGELSRFILALKKVLAEAYMVPTMVFDEIDVGIGGNALQSMAARLAELARMRQVVLITHSPQVAGYADSHYLIDKRVLNQRTYTSISLLDDEARVSELARMLAGEDHSDLTLQAAQEIIRKARGVESGI